MSYDIGLYDKHFLQRALRENLGDWRDADAIPPEILQSVRERLAAKGYVKTGQNEFEDANTGWGLQVNLFNGEISFTLPYWDDADSAIAIARTDALELALNQANPVSRID